MGRRKKEENVVEVPVSMEDGAMNPPIDETISDEKKSHPQKASTFKVVDSPTTKINCRSEANGEILFTIDNRSRVSVVGEVELNGVKWTEIHGFVMSELLKELS